MQIYQQYKNLQIFYETEKNKFMQNSLTMELNKTRVTGINMHTNND